MKNKKLISLEEANAKAFNSGRYEIISIKNGIECPKCKEELYDTDPSMVFTSDPPQKQIKCLNCGYNGYRYC